MMAARVDDACVTAAQNEHDCRASHRRRRARALRVWAHDWRRRCVCLVGDVSCAHAHAARRRASTTATTARHHARPTQALPSSSARLTGSYARTSPSRCAARFLPEAVLLRGVPRARVRVSRVRLELGQAPCVWPPPAHTPTPPTSHTHTHARTHTQIVHKKQYAGGEQNLAREIESLQKARA